MEMCFYCFIFVNFYKDQPWSPVISHWPLLWYTFSAPHLATWFTEEKGGFPQVLSCTFPSQLLLTRYLNSNQPFSVFEQSIITSNNQKWSPKLQHWSPRYFIWYMKWCIYKASVNEDCVFLYLFLIFLSYPSSKYLYLIYKYSTFAMKVLTFTNILVILALILSNINVFLIT